MTIEIRPIVDCIQKKKTFHDENKIQQQLMCLICALSNSCHDMRKNTPTEASSK